jgi:hypothetical protein
MPKVRFNIAGLLFLVLVLGVALAALRQSSDLWESGFFTATVAILLVSILLSVHRDGLTQAFWLGFAVLGWSYVVLTIVPPIESRLITTKALAYLQSKVHARRPLKITTVRHSGSWAQTDQSQNVWFSSDAGDRFVTSGQGQLWIWDSAAGKLLSGWNSTSGNFIRIGHSLLALLVAWLGGQLSRALCRGRRRPVDSTADQLGSTATGFSDGGLSASLSTDDN